jgi:hypothetical protein
MENNQGNQEFEMLLKLFVKGPNSRNPKSTGVVRFRGTCGTRSKYSRFHESKVLALSD